MALPPQVRGQHDIPMPQDPSPIHATLISTDAVYTSGRIVSNPLESRGSDYLELKQKQILATM